MQGRCGASYAFAAAAAIEGAVARATGKLKNLSAQNIIDCSGIYRAGLYCTQSIPDLTTVQCSVGTKAVEKDQLLMHTSISYFKEDLIHKSPIPMWQE